MFFATGATRFPSITLACLYVVKILRGYEARIGGEIGFDLSFNENPPNAAILSNLHFSKFCDTISQEIFVYKNVYVKGM